MTRFLSILTAIAASFQAHATGLSLDDIARIKSVTNAVVSPDGQHIAYLERNPRDPFDDEDGPAWTTLHVLTEGRSTRRFVDGDITIGDITWSPDSNGIFYLGKRDAEEYATLRAIPVDGGESIEVCALEERSIGSFSVAPDGGSIALVANAPAPEHIEQHEEQGFRANVYEESVRANEIYLIEADPAESCEPVPLELDGSVVQAQFAPGGTRLLVKLAPTPHIDDQYMHTRLKIVDLEGSINQSIENLGKLGDAQWSPDGQEVAFIGVADHNDPSEGLLKVADAKTGTIRTLTPQLKGHVMDIQWQDAEHILTLLHLGVTSQVQRIHAQTGEAQILTDRAGPVINSLSVADTGRVVAVAESPQYPDEVFEVSNGGLVRLSDSNPWLSERRLARQESVNHPSRDGLDLEGLLIYPLDYTEGERYPLIIFVHGGPEAHRSNGWLTTYSNPIQYAAAQGYFSFVPNYRGSTGRGVEFTKLHQHNYAYGEFDDIVDGKNYLVEQGLVDRDRVGITGGSYGGYATAWSATALTEHYAAGVMFVGISNQISKFGTTDIPNEMYQVHSRAWPWDDWQWMLERSPIFHVQKSRTPLLIMHGDADPRVHPSQSLEMYRYLKLAGQAPVRLIFYPDEPHGNRKAAAQYDYSVRLMRWMDHYLKGPGGEPPPHDIDYSDRIEPDDEDA